MGVGFPRHQPECRAPVGSLHGSGSAPKSWQICPGYDGHRQHSGLAGVSLPIPSLDPSPSWHQALHPCLSSHPPLPHLASLPTPPWSSASTDPALTPDWTGCGRPQSRGPPTSICIHHCQLPSPGAHAQHTLQPARFLHVTSATPPHTMAVLCSVACLVGPWLKGRGGFAPNRTRHPGAHADQFDLHVLPELGGQRPFPEVIRRPWSRGGTVLEPRSGRRGSLELAARVFPLAKGFGRSEKSGLGQSRTGVPGMAKREIM